MSWIDYKWKLFILAVLILLAVMKCWKTSQSLGQGMSLEENRGDIEAAAHEYLRLLKAEAFDSIEQVSSKSALESAMALPVNQIESYQLGDLRFEKVAADIDVSINGHDAVLFLLKKRKRWKVGALKMRK